MNQQAARLADPRIRQDTRQFDFGRNWKEFSGRALTPERVEQAHEDFQRLTGGLPISGQTFLDIGFGQGLSLMIAAASGARAVGLDINPLCAEVLDSNRRYFPELKDTPIPAHVGSILDPAVVEKIRHAAPDGHPGYDVVHSWGVLHHTGDMWQALDRAASLVRPGGILIVALYNKHFTSPAWKLVKRAYMAAPPLGQALLNRLFYPIIWLAKLAVTGKNPARMTRGMDFYYNVIDWVGGWPYEYASVDQVSGYFAELGLISQRVIPAQVPTGCNEFIFRRTEG